MHYPGRRPSKGKFVGISLLLLITALESLTLKVCASRQQATYLSEDLMAGLTNSHRQNITQLPLECLAYCKMESGHLGNTLLEPCLRSDTTMS